MDIFPPSTSTTTQHFPHSPIPFSTTSKHHFTTTTSVSFSLRPPQPPDPTNSSSLRRPKTLKSTPTTTPSPLPLALPIPTPRNPLKTLLSPSHPSSPPPAPTTNHHALSSKFWLSSKLSPPPHPLPQQENQLPETKIQQDKFLENENEAHVKVQKFRQEGKIFVGNLPNWIKKHQVSEFFRQFGPIKNVILIKGHIEIEKNAGFGFVIYDGPTAKKSAGKAVEFDGVEFHGRVLTVKLDDGRRLSAKAEERKRWLAGEDGQEYRSKWHEEREGSRKAFRMVLETLPENWQAVVSAFERIKKVKGVLMMDDPALD